MLNSLNHGNDLFEILIAGSNPYADRPLTDGEQFRLQHAGLDPAGAEVVVFGRVVMGGRGVWALSDTQLVLLGQRYSSSVDSIARSDIMHAERERGRYGDTVRVDTAQGRCALYAVNPVRAQQLLDELGY
jgi:hypothetical protein